MVFKKIFLCTIIPAWLFYLPFPICFIHLLIHIKLIYPIFSWLVNSQFSSFFKSYLSAGTNGLSFPLTSIGYPHVIIACLNLKACSSDCINHIVTALMYYTWICWNAAILLQRVSSFLVFLVLSYTERIYCAFSTNYPWCGILPRHEFKTCNHIYSLSLPLFFSHICGKIFVWKII